MNRDSRYLESVLHHDIPLTREMGLKVVSWQDRQLRLQLPLEANINHKSTMFGGSLYCGAVLAGWGWLHLSLREAGIEDGHIVIQEGHISYPLPVTEDAIAVCDAPDCPGGGAGLTAYRPVSPVSSLERHNPSSYSRHIHFIKKARKCSPGTGHGITEEGLLTGVFLH